MSVKQSWDEKITSVARRAAEYVMAYHSARGPQQYNTGGLDLLRNSSGQ